MNKIKENKEKNKMNSFKAHYLYEFESGVWDLEKKEPTEYKSIKLSTGENVVETQAFIELVKEFTINLRQNIYGEKWEDLYSLPLERLIKHQPLKDGEKVSYLIEQEEKSLLAKLKKKYENRPTI